MKNRLYVPVYSFNDEINFFPVVFTLQECYVCLWRSKSASPELEHQFPEERLPVCQRGILPPPKQCPPRYKGCLTQYSGKPISHTVAGIFHLRIADSSDLFCLFEQHPFILHFGMFVSFICKSGSTTS